MIQYSLKCGNGHSFESWFQSSDAFEALQSRGHVSCAVCGSAEVEKAIMAPSLRQSRASEPAPAPQKALSTPASPAEKALAALRQKVESSSEYVGPKFAAEARAMHDGTTPERPIYGEARPEEARRLLQDGVPVLPLPFLPARKAN